jgi:hypothetical protein
LTNITLSCYSLREDRNVYTEIKRERELSMKTNVTHNCKHTVELDVKGPRESAQYQKWLGSQPCPACREKQEERDAIVAQLKETVEQLAENVYSVASQSESAPHVVMTDEEHVTYCSCKWFRHTHFENTHHCVHADAVLAFIAERVPVAA